MVENQVTEGRRIAELLASELDGRTDGWFDQVTIANVDQDVEPSVQGRAAYDIVINAKTRGTVYLHPQRVRVELNDRIADLTAAAHAAGLPVRRKASGPPTVVILLENGAAVKPVLDVIEVLVE